MTTRRDFLKTTVATALFPIIPYNNVKPELQAFFYRTAPTNNYILGTDKQGCVTQFKTTNTNCAVMDTTACNPNPQPHCTPIEDHISVFLRGDYANIYVCRIFTTPFHLSLKQLKRYIRAMELGVTEIRIGLFSDNSPNLRFDFGTNYKFIDARWLPSHIDPLSDYDLKALEARNPNLGWTLDMVRFKCKLDDVKVTTFKGTQAIKPDNSGWCIKYTETPIDLMTVLYTYFQTFLIPDNSKGVVFV